MQVNGEKIFLQEELSLEEFLQQRRYRLDRVVAELNGVIISRESYGQILLTDADVLEIISFVGGG